MKEMKDIVCRPARRHIPVIRFITYIFVLGLLAGCAGGPRYDEQVKQAYRTGMSRDEARAVLSGSRMLSAATRPATGWPASSKDDAARAAFHFERLHPNTTVQTCEVYWVGRHTSVPMAVGGVWFDYLFFDAEDRLLDYSRRFVD